MKIVIAIFATAILIGCATAPDEFEATINSNPPGATISEGGKTVGVAPVTVRWQMTPGTTARSAPLTATWVSGAKQTNQFHLIAGKSQEFLIERPNKVPGLDTDVNWAIHLQKRASEKSKESSDFYYELGKSLGSRGGSSETRQAPISCTSNKINGSVYTNCY